MSAAPNRPLRDATPTGSLLERDRGLLWHPYASVDAGALFAVREAEGARLLLEDEQGQTHDVVDGMSSWWSAIHGYRHPVLDRAAREQLEQFSHVMFGGLTHQPAVELAERLVALTPPGLDHVFLAESGSISVEVALKLALQVQSARGQDGRRAIATLGGGYHGDTFATMSLCDPQDGMHAVFGGLVPPQIVLPRPPAAVKDASGQWVHDDGQLAQWESSAEQILTEAADRVAAIVCEPVLQGAGGMRVYPPEVLRILRRLADQHRILLIVDEIATGFGRTGQLFATSWADGSGSADPVIPDILCVGKALTGGYLTLAATLCRTELVEDLRQGPHRGALLHGPTFMGNPLACAVATASLDLLTGRTAGTNTATERTGPERTDHQLTDHPAMPWRAQVAGVERGLREALEPARQLTSVTDVRTLGAVGVIQLDRPVDGPSVTRAAVRRGAWVRPFRDLVYVMPPYIATEEQIHTLGTALVEAVEQVHG